MSTSYRFICPGTAGYEFSPNDRRVDARLLQLLTPKANELQELGPLVPILRADWLRSRWSPLKSTVVAIAGLRARLPASAIQRGSGSVWAVAATFPVPTTPSSSTLAPKLIDLVEKLRYAICEKDNTERFSNLTHLDLLSFEAPVLEAVFERLRVMAESGSVSGPFQ